MKIISAINPRWADDAQTIISLDVDFEGLGVLPFSASANDVEAHGRALFAQAAAGEYGAILLKPPKSTAEIEAEQSTAAKRTLERIDRDSIRLIREYIAAKPDAPVALKDLEIAAAGERIKVTA